MRLDVIDEHLQLGKLHLQDLRVPGDRLELVQGPVGLPDPHQQLVQGVLELAEPEEGVLELPLPLDDAPQQVVPPLVDRRQGLLDGRRLVGRGALGQLLGLPGGREFVL